MLYALLPSPQRQPLLQLTKDTRAGAGTGLHRVHAIWVLSNARRRPLSAVVVWMKHLNSVLSIIYHPLMVLPLGLQGFLPLFNGKAWLSFAFDICIQIFLYQGYALVEFCGEGQY